MSPHSKSKIGAVILAAGGSSRFQQPKQLIMFRSKSFVRRVIDATREAGCSPVVVVIGSDGERVVRELEGTNAISVENKGWQQGIGSSIRIGVQGLIDHAPDIDAIVLLVCDQPEVNADTIRNLITLREQTNKSIVASSYADTLGVAALFDRSFFQELLSLANEAGAKSIILRNRQRVAEFDFPQGAVDIDTREDWEKLNGGSASPKTMPKAFAEGAS